MLLNRQQAHNRNRVEKRLAWILLSLAIITVCNLNAIAVNVFDRSQLFSVPILLLGLVGLVSIEGPLWARITQSGRYLIGSLIAVLCVGIFAAFDAPSKQVVADAYKLIATIFLVISVAIITPIVTRRYGLLQSLKAYFLVAGVSTGSVFLGVLYPTWNELMSNASAEGRASGFFGNPNEAGTQACLFVVAGFALTAFTGRMKWLLLALGVAVPAVFFTFSRGGMLSLGVLSCCLTCIAFTGRDISRGIKILIGAAGACMCMYFLINHQLASLDTRTALHRRLNLFEQFFAGRVDRETTGGRSELAKEALWMWSQSPIIGNGIGALNHMPHSGLGPHNAYLEILGETGLVGFMSVLFGMTYAITRGNRIDDKCIRLFVIGTLLSLVLDGLAAHGTFGHRNFMFSLGFMFGIEGFYRHEIRQHKPIRKGHWLHSSNRIV